MQTCWCPLTKVSGHQYLLVPTHQTRHPVGESCPLITLLVTDAHSPNKKPPRNKMSLVWIQTVSRRTDLETPRQPRVFRSGSRQSAAETSRQAAAETSRQAAAEISRQAAAASRTASCFHEAAATTAAATTAAACSVSRVDRKKRREPSRPEEAP